MKHNENFQRIAFELMTARLAELEAKEQASNTVTNGTAQGPGLTIEEHRLLGQLRELTDDIYSDCPECLGVGRVRFAYTALLGEGGYTISRAFEDQAGHMPCRDIKPFKSYDAAQQWAEEHNTELGLDRKEAFRIVTSSMRAENLKARS